MLVLTLREFKMWFDGFSQGVSDSPTKEQWEMIKKKMDEVSAHPHHNYWNELHTRSPLQPSIAPSPLPYIITCNTGQGSVVYDTTHRSSTSCASAWN